MQRGRLRLFAVLVLLTLLASPLAFLLLVVLLAGVGVSTRIQHFRFVAAVVGSAGLLEVALYRIFPRRRTLPVRLAGASCRRCCSACTASS